jgi:hypothetical protein
LNRASWKSVILIILIITSPLFAELPAQTSNFASPAYWGMAHSGAAIAEINNTYLLNPSLVPFSSSWSVNINEAFIPGMQISISELSGHYIFKESHALNGGINFENYGTFEQRDINGNLNGEFSAAQYQVFLGYAYKMSDYFQAGAQLVFQGNRISTSRENSLYLRYGLSYSFAKQNDMIAFSGISDGLDNAWRASFSHELEYLPLRVNIDFRWQGDDWSQSLLLDDENNFNFQKASRYFAQKLSIGFYIKASENLRIMSGVDLARLDLASNNYGLDNLLSGLALGASYTFGNMDINLGIYHYTNYTMMTALGVSYSAE